MRAQYFSFGGSAIFAFVANVTFYLAVTDPTLKAMAWISITCRIVLILWIATKPAEELVYSYSVEEKDLEDQSDVSIDATNFS